MSATPKTQESLPRAVLVVLMNEWMRRFIEEPEKFSRQFQDVQTFMAEEAEGKEPTYGEQCTNYLFWLRKDLISKPNAEDVRKMFSDIDSVGTNTGVYIIDSAAVIEISGEISPTAFNPLQGR